MTIKKKLILLILVIFSSYLGLGLYLIQENNKTISNINLLRKELLLGVKSLELEIDTRKITGY